MLTHPADLAAWQRWQGRRRPLRSLRQRLRPGRTAGVLTRGGPQADVLVVLDSTAPSSLAALLAPARHVPQERLLVLAPAGMAGLLPGDGWAETRWAGEPLPRVASVLTTGHYLPLGAATVAHARSVGATTYVVQHGLLTPANPPLPAGATAVAWTEADADFWRSARPDVATTVVGSQLIWAATAEGGAEVADGPPTYLGQLHAAELPRRSLAAAAGAFCRDTGATYRPHPSEQDRRSRRQHERWRRQGIRVADDGPLVGLGTGVVAAFSTGVLEAAAHGMPAWVDHPDPPPWLRAFWERYGMHTWGREPTPAPRVPAEEPARAVARLLEGTP